MHAPREMLYSDCHRTSSYYRRRSGSCLQCKRARKNRRNVRNLNRSDYRRRGYLPAELVTSVVAARKGETGLAVGNVIGSNIFNILFILGVSTVIHPIGVNVASVYDLMILIAVSIITYLFAIGKKAVKRPEGIFMLGLYIASVAFAILR